MVPRSAGKRGAPVLGDGSDEPRVQRRHRGEYGGQGERALKKGPQEAYNSATSRGPRRSMAEVRLGCSNGEVCVAPGHGEAVQGGPVIAGGQEIDVEQFPVESLLV